MNHFNELLSSDASFPADASFDRLVDGEATPAERRALLQQLDEQPDGWRRCALAFLQVQAWRIEMADWHPAQAPSPASDVPASGIPASDNLASTVAPDAIASVLKTPPVAFANRYGKPLIALAMAASFFLAFAAGLALRGAWRPQDAHDSSPLASTPTSTTTEDSRPLQPSEPMENQNLASTAQSPLAADFIWLSPPSESEGRYAQVPQEVAIDLKRFGRPLQLRHELWPVQLHDGSRAVLPVERLDVEYDGFEYQ